MHAIDLLCCFSIRKAHADGKKANDFSSSADNVTKSHEATTITPSDAGTTENYQAEISNDDYIEDESDENLEGENASKPESEN